MGDFLDLVWILVLLQVFIPLLQQRMQETMSLLGLPIARYIDIEDSEQVLPHVHRWRERWSLTLS